jgi:hypothetical protein
VLLIARGFQGLKDNNGDSVAIGVCHNVCLDLVLMVFGSDGLVGLSKVAV